ncbi:hypothetical protein [Bradyrhizobium diazoefficiens]|uniref:hypothetical protein n=1 Tax=Bradyrhizobium diazoefficiens TaxID=1355477 RepID=UPI0004BB32C8|nr:hypothetical protein [Bradyrhizobium diazoefficiens]
MKEKQTIEARLCETAEELQIIVEALVYAEENRGDTTKYRNDVARYDALGIEAAQVVADLITETLNGYLGSKPY